MRLATAKPALDGGPLSASLEGRGDPLLLLHAAGNAWYPVRPALARRYECLTVDLPGFGHSPALDPAEEASVPRLADSVEAQLAALDWERPSIVGSSLGGSVALELARRGRARSVVAISPFGLGTERENRRTRRRSLAARRGARISRRVAPLVVRTALGRTAMGYAGYQLSRPWRHHGEDMLETMDRYFLAPGFVPGVTWALSHRPHALEEIRCPVTIAWGERDRLLPPRQAARFTERIPGATRRVLAGCGHIPMSDDAALVASVILEELAAAHAPGRRAAS